MHVLIFLSHLFYASHLLLLREPRGRLRLGRPGAPALGGCGGAAGRRGGPVAPGAALRRPAAARHRLRPGGRPEAVGHGGGQGGPHLARGEGLGRAQGLGGQLVRGGLRQGLCEEGA